MPTRTVTASAITTDRAHKAEGSASVLAGSYEAEGDLKPIYLLVLTARWNGHEVKITSWNDDPSENLSDECLKSAWEEFNRGLDYQSGRGLVRYLKEEVQRKEKLNLSVPLAAEELFDVLLKNLKSEMTKLYPYTPRPEAVDQVEVEFEAESRA